MDDQPDRSARTGGEQERARYDRDLYSWAMEQAALLRAGRVTEADVLNIAEEIEDVGKNEYYRLESALRIILLHLLKWDHQPERRSRSWWSSVTVQREGVRDLLQDNPGLQPSISKAIERAYRKARVEASAQTRKKLNAFPVRCPYDWDEIVDRPIEWPQD